MDSAFNPGSSHAVQQKQQSWVVFLAIAEILKVLVDRRNKDLKRNVVKSGQHGLRNCETTADVTTQFLTKLKLILTIFDVILTQFLSDTTRI